MFQAFFGSNSKTNNSNSSASIQTPNVSNANHMNKNTNGNSNNNTGNNNITKVNQENMNFENQNQGNAQNTNPNNLSPGTAAVHVNMTPRKKNKAGISSGTPNTASKSSSNLVFQSDEYVKLTNELKAKDETISSLHEKIAKLAQELEVSLSQSSDPMPSDNLGKKIAHRPHGLVTKTHVITDNFGREQVDLGTRGSMLTTKIVGKALDSKIQDQSEEQMLAEKFIQIFQNPVDYIPYLNSSVFANDLIKVCAYVGSILESESRCLFLQSPAYVFGDIHGNVEDLHFFSDNIWKLGVDLTAGQFLFLGDYVDRGLNGLECLAYLFGMKILYPKKIFLLRGNHETRDVNGWEEHYAEKSFLYQCKERFGISLGEEVWEECNCAFDRMPVSAVIDHDIFCVHGGIPRPIKEKYESEIEAILALPTIQGIMPAYEEELEWSKQVSSDCIWSDPAPESIERKLPPSGFGSSPRGGGAVMFGAKAIDNFLRKNNLSYIIRAHEAHAQGVALSKGARVFTVFSTSRDHRQGSAAMAGCILVDVEDIQVINRSPKYRNKYVHRRTSVSVQNLTSDEIEIRRRMGLIRTSIADQTYLNIKQERIQDDIKHKNRIAMINDVSETINEDDMEEDESELV